MRFNKKNELLILLEELDYVSKKIVESAKTYNSGYDKRWVERKEKIEVKIEEYFKEKYKTLY